MGKEMQDKKTCLVYFDIAKQGADVLDRFFNDKVELAEVFTVGNTEGYDILDITAYEGWDYLVITCLEKRDELLELLLRMGLDRNQIIFLNQTELYCEDEEKIKSILRDDYYSVVMCGRMVQKYKASIKADYSVVTAEGCSYLNNASDMLIMGKMYTTGMNWAGDTMIKFKKLAERYYIFSEKQNLFFDIGANIGTTCIYFKKKLDPKIKIVAFEPSAENYKMLKINMLLNDIDEGDVWLVKKGISDQNDTMSFCYNAFNSGGSRFEKDNNTGTKIQTISFDEYMNKEAIDPMCIKYIWVDVEGFEPYFVKGGMETLQKINAPIVMEFAPDSYVRDGVYRDYMDNLKKIYRGYICMQDEEEIIHDIEELACYENCDTPVLLDLFLLKDISKCTVF